ncbi:X antigen family member 3-like [Leopardus geoffroyi]|uniref:X antigen family member 3-like n=1 Tax=Leopardus geoffroyi TaxID=46844 RepID=UPI001E262B8C|nr:X antigen family member 3-like [Leopardus geoffroyi]
MSWQIRSTFKPRARRNDQNSFQLVGPVVPSIEQRQQEEPPTDLQDSMPDQEKKDKVAPVVQGPSLEPDQQELVLPKTRREHGDGPDVRGKRLANLESLKMPEAGEGQSQV